jgi:hypothetical protein
MSVHPSELYLGGRKINKVCVSLHPTNCFAHWSIRKGPLDVEVFLGVCFPTVNR